MNQSKPNLIGHEVKPNANESATSISAEKISGQTNRQTNKQTNKQDKNNIVTGYR